MEDERGLDRAAAIAEMRFSFIEKVCRAAVVKPKESKEHMRSRTVDRILTGKYTAIPMFVLIMAIVFLLTFNAVGKVLADLLDLGIKSLSEVVSGAMIGAGVNEVVGEYHDPQRREKGTPFASCAPHAPNIGRTRALPW